MNNKTCEYIHRYLEDQSEKDRREYKYRNAERNYSCPECDFYIIVNPVSQGSAERSFKAMMKFPEVPYRLMNAMSILGKSFFEDNPKTND